MSTLDVPGANPANGDTLAMGCWAEHADGSITRVEGNEQGTVYYTMFDVSKQPPTQWRGAMTETRFKTLFSWDESKKRTAADKDVPKEKWVWHDKTPFPWAKFISKGAAEGVIQTEDDILSAAERVANALKLMGTQVANDQRHRMDDERPRRPAQGEGGLKEFFIDTMKQAIRHLEK